MWRLAMNKTAVMSVFQLLSVSYLFSGKGSKRETRCTATVSHVFLGLPKFFKIILSSHP